MKDKHAEYGVSTFSYPGRNLATFAVLKPLLAPFQTATILGSGPFDAFDLAGIDGISFREINAVDRDAAAAELFEKLRSGVTVNLSEYSQHFKAPEERNTHLCNADRLIRKRHLIQEASPRIFTKDTDVFFEVEHKFTDACKFSCIDVFGYGASSLVSQVLVDARLFSNARKAGLGQPRSCEDVIRNSCCNRELVVSIAQVRDLFARVSINTSSLLDLLLETPHESWIVFTSRLAPSSRGFSSQCVLAITYDHVSLPNLRTVSNSLTKALEQIDPLRLVREDVVCCTDLSKLVERGVPLVILPESDECRVLWIENDSVERFLHDRSGSLDLCHEVLA